MTPGYDNKNKNLSAITLGLIAILLFIRINPIYYVAQFMPVRHTGAHSLTVVRRADNNQSILRCQRAVSERLEVIAVPQIRFTGVPFTAFFAESVIGQPQTGIINIFKKLVLSAPERIALLRTLRL